MIRFDWRGIYEYTKGLIEGEYNLGRGVINSAEFFSEGQKRKS